MQAGIFRQQAHSVRTKGRFSQKGERSWSVLGAIVAHC
jgi:hypothetical protein